jgi:hypothetical protein
METKKKLILRLASGCGTVLASALFLLLVAELKEASQRRAHEEQRRQRREQTVERSRKYIAEVARRVTRVPADATVLGEIESRYFEEYPRRMHVWAMGPTGEFLFGVPREAFAKLNAIYDRDVVPRLRDGVFLDRQTFLRRLVDESEEIDAGAFAEEEEAQPESDGRAEREETRERRRAQEAWERWGRGTSEDHDRAFVLSTPLKGADGQALGSLYVKTVYETSRDDFHRGDESEVLASVGAIGAAAGGFGLWLLLPSWVFVDARARGVRRAPLWAFLTALSVGVGLLVYLIARPEHPRTLPCPGCGKDVDGGAFCPHCGRDLSAAFCAACRYPLKPDWTYCPTCRTEIRPQPAVPPVPETAS